MRAQVEALKAALRAAHVPGLDLGGQCSQVKRKQEQEGLEQLEAQLRRWQGICEEHGVGVPEPEAKTTMDEEEEIELELGGLFD